MSGPVRDVLCANTPLCFDRCVGDIWTGRKLAELVRHEIERFHSSQFFTHAVGSCVQRSTTRLRSRWASMTSLTESVLPFQTTRIAGVTVTPVSALLRIDTW